MTDLPVHDLGRASFDGALAVQRRLLGRVQAGRERAHLVLTEHVPAVITLGRRGRREDVLASDAELHARGVELRCCQRGGQVTWHGPGQVVAYPIVDLRGRRRSVHAHVHALESAVIDLLARFGLAGRRRAGQRGVWVADAKVAAVGVAVSRWVAWHGLAVNVSPDLGGFDLIVPCGEPGAKVTSLSALLQRPVRVEQIKPMLIDCLRRALRRPSPSRAGGPGRLPRLPRWLRRSPPTAGRSTEVRRLLDRLGLHTVCHSARCPNIGECFARGTATFLILGPYCTRRCRFCAVEGRAPEAVRDAESEAVAEAAAEMGLRHVVITSVTRDDLPDGGAAHFARTIAAVRRRLPRASIEVLTPDFQGDAEAVRTVISAGPDVFNHNVETVPRLYASVRPQADYARSLGVLATARRTAAEGGRAVCVKSGLMVGLGETREELRRVWRDLRESGCEVLTIGQYLAPSSGHVSVARFVPPEEFRRMRAEARELGFAAVAAGPFVRSSYRAEAVLRRARHRHSNSNRCDPDVQPVRSVS